MLTPIDNFLEKLKLFNSNICIVYKYEEYTFLSLIEKINKYSEYLENRGLKSCVVTLNTDWSIYGVAMFFSILKNKCIVSPIIVKDNMELELKMIQSNSNYLIEIDSNTGDVKCTKCTNKIKHKAPVINLLQNNQPGLIIYSSGTSGKHKAMLHDFNLLLDSYINKKKKSVCSIATFLFDHIGGLNTLLNSLSYGGRIVLPHDKSIRCISELIQKYNVTLLPASPTFLNLLSINQCNREYDFSSIRLITYGGEPMPKGLLLKLKKQYKKARFLQTFGTSETGIIQTSTDFSDSLQIKIDDPGKEIKIVDGELWIKSKTRVLCYLNADNDRLLSGGWFKTGDIVKESGDGKIQILGRKDDVINVGGSKVLPSEIESVAYLMDCILDCVAYGEMNSIMGQIVCLDVVASEDISNRELRIRIRKWFHAKLDRYKVPSKINFVDSLEYGRRYKKIRSRG